jgi:hypothetical protein
VAWAHNEIGEVLHAIGEEDAPAESFAMAVQVGTSHSCWQLGLEDTRLMDGDR